MRMLRSYADDVYLDGRHVGQRTPPCHDRFYSRAGCRAAWHALVAASPAGLVRQWTPALLQRRRATAAIRESAGGGAVVPPAHVLDLSQGPESGKSMLSESMRDRALGLVGDGTLGVEAISASMSRSCGSRDPLNGSWYRAWARLVALATFVNAGDRVVLFEPTSPLFEVLAAARGTCRAIATRRGWRLAFRRRSPGPQFARRP